LNYISVFYEVIVKFAAALARHLYVQRWIITLASKALHRSISLLLTFQDIISKEMFQ